MSDEHLYKVARKRVAEKKSFYSHLASYLAVGLFFIFLNLRTSPGRWWFYWPMLGWGIGLVSHYFRVFGFFGSDAGTSDWEEREVKREVERMRNRRGEHSMDEYLNKKDAGEYKPDDLV